MLCHILHNRKKNKFYDFIYFPKLPLSSACSCELQCRQAGWAEAHREMMKPAICLYDHCVEVWACLFVLLNVTALRWSENKVLFLWFVALFALRTRCACGHLYYHSAVLARHGDKEPQTRQRLPSSTCNHHPPTPMQPVEQPQLQKSQHTRDVWGRQQQIGAGSRAKQQGAETQREQSSCRAKSNGHPKEPRPQVITTKASYTWAGWLKQSLQGKSK